ncbi:hypothetical protein Lal_00002323 [Lupinus albus]|uniref:Putative histone acetyltransferase chromatin regulator PHD family n=1 Tax=Lupinus albus TaxID=3870 RepID=A0A6A4PRR4_LUPAL|nr:putative histone acetyltransferase chromatin regulator PHD family [Lupinus albus]KAF1893793.1 hypothetical protein Lal_00002323 [Lupinus albus]
MGTEGDTSNSGYTECAEQIQCLQGETNSNGVEVANGNGFAEEFQHFKSGAFNNGVAVSDVNDVTEEALCFKSEAINSGVAVSDGNDVMEEALCLKNEAFNDGVTIANGNDVIEDALCLKSEAINNVVAVLDGSDVMEEALCLKREACNNGVAIADGNVVTEEGLCLQSEAISNAMAVADGFDSADRDSGGVECLRIYKRRKRGKSSSDNKDDSRECVEAASHLENQETLKINKVRQERSSQLEWLPHRTQGEPNGHANVMHNGCSSKTQGHGVTQTCQRVLCDILKSEKFQSLWKALLENFQGMKPGSVFDFNIMTSRVMEKAYEQSPALFLSDMQQVWQKLQDTGNEIVDLAKSLSNMSRTSYRELLNNRESDSHMKLAQTEEHARYKICSCRRCGDKTDGTDCLVCDSCEEMYHVSCIEPPVKEIPHKSWLCANCTARAIGSPHENCVVCEKLNDVKTENNVVGDESFNDDGIEVSTCGENLPVCKICGNDVDGEKIKKCGHPVCSNKYYHVRCLTSKQLKSYSHCWYCPSCLCRVCFTDQDDDKIVLCDGCDHAYHIYCMKPIRTSIPKGNWFCKKCDAGIQAIRRAKKAYEINNRRRTEDDVSKPSVSPEKKCIDKRAHELGTGGGMDMLLTAANTLNLEENLACNPN